MAKRKIEDSLDFHSDNGPAHFAVNVKWYGAADTTGLSDDDASRAYDFAREDFWSDARGLAESIFGVDYTVYAEGRSGGWMVPGKKVVNGRVTAETHGFTIEQCENDPALRKKCRRFGLAVTKMLTEVEDYVRRTADVIREQKQEDEAAYNTRKQVLLEALALYRAQHANPTADTMLDAIGRSSSDEPWSL